VVQNAVQNPRVQNVGNQNGLIVVPGIANQNPNGNGNLIAARAEGNATGLNDLDEIEEVNANYILMTNLQQASTSGTQTDKALVYDSDRSAENYMQQPMPNPEDITDPTTAINMELALMAKAFKLNYSTLTNNNQRISSNPRNRKIAQPGMNMGQDRHMQMVGVQNVRNQVVQNAVQNPRVQNVGNQNGLIVVPGIANQNPNGNVHNERIQNQIGNGNLVAVRAEGNAAGHNENKIRRLPTEKSIGINIPVQQRTYIMSRVRMLRVRTFSRAGNAMKLIPGGKPTRVVPPIEAAL
nr:hypothetical protein [Tanacetum cinerariifolium]